jgi:predicted DNA-binding transcriptional regulator AlpA
MIPDPTTRSCVTADEAFAELGIDRTTGYRAIQEGTFPVPIIRVGRLIRVPTAPLRRLLDPLLGDADHDELYDEDCIVERPAGPTLKLVPRPDVAHDECSEAE